MRLECNIFYYSTIVGPYFSHSTIPSTLAFSIAATTLYLILKVFKICNFLGSGVLKHKCDWGSQSGRCNVIG